MNTGRKQLLELAREVGADRFDVVRSNRHLIVDFFFGKKCVRTALSVSASDHRTIHNQVKCIRKACREKGI